MKKPRVSFISLIFLCSLIFQVSVIPDSLQIKAISRIVNMVILFILAGMVIHTIKDKKPTKIVFLYIVPIVFILVGCFINIVRSIDEESLGYTSVLLRWLAALCLPFIVSFNIEKCWNIFYYFILTTIIISLIEYYAIFSGLLEPTIIKTNNGVFYKGIISILYRKEFVGSFNRFYGVFAEPGTAAMILLPAIAYALIFSKKLALCVFLWALFLTNSLGGFFGLLVLISSFTYWKFDGLSSSPKLLVVLRILTFVLIFLAVSNLEDYFYTAYEKKGGIEGVREDNIKKFSNNFFYSIIENPFGFELSGKKLSNLGSDENYYGSTLSFYVAFVTGGLLGLIGYSAFFLIVSFFSIRYYFMRHNPNKISACAFLSLPALLTFCFQRTTIFESVLFAFLFAVPVVNMIRKKGSTQGIVTPQNTATRPQQQLS